MTVPLVSHPPEALPRGQRQRLILRLLRRPEQKPARRLLARLHPADIAQLFPMLTPDEQRALFEILIELRLGARTLRELDAPTQESVLATISDETLHQMLRRLSADDAADLLERLDDERRARVLSLLEPGLALHLENLMRYGAATAGGLMDPDLPRFRAEQSVAETLEQVRQLAEGRRLFYLYVVDERGHLLGIVSLWQLVSAPADRKLRDILRPDVVTVRVDMPEAEVAQVFQRYDLLLVPVLDEDGRLAGAISVDDVLDVVEERATEDLYHLANLDTQETLTTPVRKATRLRFWWLLINLCTAFLAASVVSMFQATIAKYVVLAVFMPIVAGMGGNAGTQTLTVMVRGLAVGEADLSSWARMLGRQTLIGWMNGFGTGLVLGVVAGLWERNPVLGFILFIAEMVNLTIAGFFGALVPLTLRRWNLDPALGSSIFVTTATDVGGFVSFLGTATLLITWLHP
jgi:magnesium transporter